MRRDVGAIDETVAVVLLAGVSYLTGAAADIAAVTAARPRRGCAVVLDLAHAAGNVPLDLHASDVDAAAWCTYKYLNGGPGAPGAIYVHERHHDAPRLAGWWGVDAAERFRMEADFVAGPGAAGFALSTPPVLALAPLAASLRAVRRGRLRRAARAVGAPDGNARGAAGRHRRRRAADAATSPSGAAASSRCASEARAVWPAGCAPSTA